MEGMVRLPPAALLLAALACAGCATPPPPPPSVEREWGADLARLERQVRTSDDFDLRCLAASLCLTYVTAPGLERAERRQWAEIARVHASAAIGLHGDRAEGHYHRAVATGRVLEHSILPDLSLIGELDAAGARARELDPGFHGGGPLRLLAELYWKAPAWPVGPENAQDHDLVDALFREAIARAPGCTENHVLYAEYLVDRRRAVEAVAHVFAANACLPRDPIATPFDRPDLRARIEKLEAALMRLGLLPPG
jgi:hypothetical protein